jgi:hypothetical protein
MHRRIRAFLLVAGVLAGCGDETTLFPDPPDRPATLAELTGPWRAHPLQLDPAMRGRVEQVCSTFVQRPPGGVPAVIDARGGGFVTVRMTDVWRGSCDGIAISVDGQVTAVGSGSFTDAHEELPALDAAELGPLEVSASGGGPGMVGGYVVVYGRAGAAIATVEVEPLRHPKLLATLENGWFAAWWPADVRDQAPAAPRAMTEFLVRGYDEAGHLLAETRPER